MIRHLYHPIQKSAAPHSLRSLRVVFRNQFVVGLGQHPSLAKRDVRIHRKDRIAARLGCSNCDVPVYSVWTSETQERSGPNECEAYESYTNPDTSLGPSGEA